MKTKNSVKNQLPASVPEPYETSTVTSKDGTTIGYRKYGQGPGVVVLHGTMSSAHNHRQIAEALADAFTIYIPDRRSRGLSGSYRKDYSVQTEVEDLDALLTKTDSHFVFGVSSGAIIALQAAVSMSNIHKIAIFEPPIFTDSAPTAFIKRYDKEMAKGKVASALITAMKGAQMGPPIFNLIPRWLIEPLTRMAIASEDKKEQSDYVPMRLLAPTLHYDFQLVVEISGKLGNFRAVAVEVLLLGGSKSPAYLKTALDGLEKVLPYVKRVEFPGLNHAASWNDDRGGQPEPIAQELRHFFA